jgi:menaquinone-dependent protoporphyrinogen oxidase
MSNILIIYSSSDGHTFHICERIKDLFLAKGNGVNIVSVKDIQHLDYQVYDKILIGASIRYGKHSKLIFELIKEQLMILNKVPSAFFSVNLVARKENKNTAETNPYLKKFLNKITWKPRLTSVFAGKIIYPKYNFFDRIMIQLIMWMTKGPTDPSTIKEYTNWNRVDEFAKDFLELK